MTGSQKKRKGRSPSPGQNSNPRKRAQVQHDADPVEVSNRGTPFEASAEWNFRIQVLASTDPTARVFVKAVQDLVQVCFPNGVLSELGADVVATHMQQEDAPEENIARMRKVFDEQMLTRMASLVVEFFHSPQDLKSCLESLLDACRSKHGNNFVLELQQSNAFAELLGTPASGDDRTASPGSATMYNSRSGRSSDITPTIRESSHDGRVSFPTQPKCSVDTLTEAQTSKEKSKKKSKKLAHREATEGDKENKSAHPSMEGVIQPPVAQIEPENAKRSTKKNKFIKVSRSWRWDIDQETFDMENLNKHFKKASDLFAFHALPTVQEDLAKENNATKDSIRLQMEEMLSAMLPVEIARWEDSFSKLQNGDVDMLIRRKTRDHGQSISPSVAGIPGSDNHQGLVDDEPVTRRIVQHAASTDGNMKELGHRGSGESVIKASIKTEQDVSAQAQAPQEANMMTETISALRRLLVEPQTVNLFPKTPIVGHLWGKNAITEKDLIECVGKVMNSINQRLPQPTYTLSCFGGGSSLLSKSDFELKLTQDLIRGSRRNKVDLGQFVHRCESFLIPLVAAQPNSFPEIRRLPLSFVYMFLDTTPVLDLMVSRSTKFSSDNCQSIRHYIVSSIEMRGIDKRHRCGPRNRTVCDQLGDIFSKNLRGVERRGQAERVLRYLALDFKATFPELKSSKLVKAWEIETGMRW